jgi:hypothetical protein
VAWYKRLGEEGVIQPGDRIFVGCEGGPSISRLEIYPPRVEIEERDGIYVLEDDGSPEQWRYLFVPRKL